MVDESGLSLKHAPHSLHARPFVVQPGMRHVADFEREEEQKGGVKAKRLEELKRIDEGLQNKRKPKTSRKLFGELLAPGTKLAPALGATRTLQPVKDFNLGALGGPAEAEEEEPKKKLSLAILQTHRFFSDLDDSKDE